jgi:sterol desaturase/sphingolipid hydroxylase (fatty acid hydroxylase superfamily)
MISLFPVLPSRTGIAAGGFIALLALEQLAPFKKPVDRRLPRYLRNVFLMVFNGAAMQWLFGGAIIAFTAFLAEHQLGLLNHFHVSGPAAFAVSFLTLDLATYAFHWAYHVSPPLWRLHRVHHSDLDLDVTSASRFHIGEILLSTIYRIGVIAYIGPTFGAIVAFEASLLAFAQFEHSNIKLPGDWDRRLRWVLVSPDMHRVHHSDVRGHTNSNYGTIFTCWDRLFGTFNVDGIDQERIKIGIPEYQKLDEVTLPKLLVMPLGPRCQVAGRSPLIAESAYGKTPSPV